MPVKKEADLKPVSEAPADMSTQLSFDPVNGPFDETTAVEGSIGDGDKDWIVIELSEGKEYTIKVSGHGDNPLNDTVLRLLDAKGEQIDMNDDIRPAGTTDDGPGKTDLSSQIKFPSQAGSGTQKYFLEVSAYTGNPFAENTGGYRVTVTEKAVLPVGDGADIVGTKNADKLAGTEGSESIMGLAGDDTLVGAGGDDTLHGGAGNDLLIGGKGADTLRGGRHDDYVDGRGGDTISYDGSAEGVTINLRDGTAMGGDAQGDTLGSDIENVIGSAYDDMITGTDSVQYGNSLWGLAGMDRLYGGEGADMLYGGAGDDILSGGDEDDTLEGGAGADELTGGLGDDTASYTSSAAGVIVRLHSGQAMGGDAEGDTWGDMVTVTYEVDAEDPEDPEVVMSETVPDIIHLMGSGMADVLAGDSRNNTIMGGAGDDRIFGGPGGGNDILHGDAGNDRLYGGRGNDTLRGMAGNDHLWGNGGEDKLFGGNGNDWYYLVAGRNNQTVDEVTEIEGDDDRLEPVGRMGGGTDWISFANSRFAIGAEGDGNDFDIWDNIEGAVGSDEDDYITGNASDNIIEGRDGGDTLMGGASTGDTLSYENSDRRVRVDLADGSDTASSASGGHATGDEISGFEHLTGSAYGDILTALSTDSGIGSAGMTGSTLKGLGGDDTLEGGSGNDTLIGGAGADELNGGYTFSESANGTVEGTENDEANTLSYEGSDAAVVVNLATATASGGHAQGDDIETYEFSDSNDNGTPDETGDNGDDDAVDVATFVNLTGSDHNDRLTGDRFGNFLKGGKGDDTLRGGDGNDRLEGGAGADNLDGGKSPGEPRTATDWDVDATDWAVYRGAMSGVTVRMTAEGAGMGTRGDAMGDSLKGIEVVWGSLRHDDVFIAGPGADIFHGDGHDKGDTVSFEASKHGVSVNLATHNSNNGYGNGAGADGVLGNDDDPQPSAWTIPTIAYNHDIATDADGTATTNLPGIAAATGFSEKGYQVGDLYGGIENLTGSSLGDTLTGNDQNNTLKGGAGNDLLRGAGGEDTIHGDAGNDTIQGDVSADGTVQTGADDILKGFAGNDTIHGNGGADEIDGGAGDDTLMGDSPNNGNTTPGDVFIFAPGHGSDVIVDFAPDGGGSTPDGTGTGGDKIDLSAFDLTADDLKAPGVISVRAGNIIINLEGHGGGRITLQGLTDLDVLDTQGIDVDTETNPADRIGDLSEFDDQNGEDAGVGDGTDGIFIL